MRIIKDFLMFLRMRDELDIAELDNALKFRLSSENPELEKRINDVVMFSLAKKLIRNEVTPEYAEGFKQALMLRLHLKKTKSISTDKE